MAMRASKPYKVKPGNVEQTSSPAKVYHSRAAKPSSVAAVTLANAGATYTSAEQALLNGLKAKMNELLIALKK